MEKTKSLKQRVTITMLYRELQMVRGSKQTYSEESC